MTRTAWWVVLAVATAGWAEGAKPELRIDPGCHMATANGICFVNGDRQLATRGIDGVVRIWDVATGELVRALRLRAQHEAYGLVVSRDGHWLAAASSPNLVAVYDTATWRLARVLRLCSIVLSFTPDCRSVVGPDVDSPTGLVVGDIATGEVRTVATSLPGDIALRGFSAMSCSPDGKAVAVGRWGSLLVLPLAGGSARLMTGLPGTVDALTWLGDSRRLLVHTRVQPSMLSLWDIETGTMLRAWEVDGGIWGLALTDDGQTAWVSTWGGVVAYRVSDGARQQVLSSPVLPQSLALSNSGHLLAACTESGGAKVWGLRAGNVIFDRQPVSVTATAVGWRKTDRAIGYGAQPAQWPPEPEAPIERWLRAQTLDGGEPTPAEQWCRPVWQSDRGSLQYRRVGDFNRLQVIGPDGRALGPGYKWAVAATWLQDGQVAVFDDYRLVVANPATGASRQQLTGWLRGVSAVAQSPCARYLLGGCTDSTLRIWPLTTDAKEVPPLLSIFPAKDGNWVAWTEEGYYACTPAAEKWIGWQINRGEDEEPDYYPAAQFREQFYRPDVIMRLLDAGSVAEAVKQADAARKQQTDTTKVAARIAEFAPPKVEIVEPADGATVATGEVNLRLRVKDPNNRKVVAVIPLVNGRPLTGGRFILVPSRDPTEQQVTVPLNPGENTISAIATNDAGSHSVPVSVTVRCGAEEQKPAMYVLAVGVSAYANKDYALRYAAKDATDLANVLKQQAGKLFRKVDVKLLTDKEASQGGVLDALDWLTKQVTQRDYAVVFLAGHGLADSAGEYYFLPADGDTERLRRTGLHWSQFRTALRALPGKVLLALDTCHSAGATGARKAGARLDYTNVLRDALSDEVGLITLSSCMPSEVSYEQDEWHNGAFTKALVEALSGQADHNGDGVVTLAELDAYISERVKALTMGRQHATCERPATVRSVLPVVMVKSGLGQSRRRPRARSAFAG